MLRVATHRWPADSSKRIFYCINEEISTLAFQRRAFENFLLKIGEDKINLDPTSKQLVIPGNSENQFCHPTSLFPLTLGGEVGLKNKMV